LVLYLIGGAIGYGEAMVKFGMEREKRGNKKRALEASIYRTVLITSLCSNVNGPWC
jgi:hypothetical protein